VQLVTLVLALAALVIAVLAYIRTGAIQDLSNQASSLGSATGAIRAKTADALDRLGTAVRGSRQTPPSSVPKKSKPVQKRKTG
jgi:hypothetical protein